MTVAPYDPNAIPRRVLVEFNQGSAVIRKGGVLERVEQPAPVAWVRMDDGPTEFVALERVKDWPGGEGPPAGAVVSEPGDGEAGLPYVGDGRTHIFRDDLTTPLPPGVAKLARSMPATRT